MKKNLAVVFLSTIFFAPNSYSMDVPPVHKETAPAQRLDPHKFIAPGMMVIWNGTPDRHIALKIFGQNNQLIYEAKLPVQIFTDIAVAKDGTLYIFGTAENVVAKNDVGVIFEVKNGKTPEQLKYEFESLQEIKYLDSAQDGTLLISGFVSGTNPGVGIFALKNGKLELQVGDLDLGSVMGSASDGTIFIKKEEEGARVESISGAPRHNKFSILRVKGGKVLGDLGFQKEDFDNFIARPDGTVFMKGYSSGVSGSNEIISVTKDGKVKFTGPQSYGLHGIREFTFGPDGTLFILGSKNEIISVTKDNKVKSIGSQSYGFHDIREFTFGPDGTLFILGSKEKDSSDFSDRVILTMKNGQTSELPNYGWLKHIYHLDVASDGTLFIDSSQSIFEGASKQCVLMVKDEKNLGNMCTEFTDLSLDLAFNLQKIKGAISLKDILTKNEEEKVFSKEHQEGVNQQAFEDLCTTIKGFAPSLFSHEDGRAFYHFFAPHVINFPHQHSHAGHTIYSLLETLTSDEKLPISGYAFALYLDVSGLQGEMITADKHMSSEKLLDLKKERNFKERFQATQEAQKILEAIVNTTSSDFSESYKILLEKVDTALESLELQEKAQASSHPAR